MSEERKPATVERVDGPLPLDIPTECPFCGDAEVKGKCSRRCASSLRADDQKKTWRTG